MADENWYDCGPNESSTQIQCSEIIGYSPTPVKLFFLIFPILGFLSNGYLVFYYFWKKKDKTKQ